YEAYGWHLQEVEDGSSIEALCAAAERATQDERPSFIRVRTVIGFPAPTKQNTADAHGAPLGAKENNATKAIMGWKLPPFEVPATLAAAKEKIVAQGAQAQREWEQKFSAYQVAHPQLADAFTQTLAGTLPSGWEDGLPSFEANEKGIPTRKASGE